MNTEEKLNRYVLHSYGRYPMAAVRGEGSRLWDSTGKCYLDFCAGIATCALGHCHPVVTQALQKQAATLVHCSNLYQIPQQADLAEFIVTKCVERPGKVFFSNSGAESNDGLIKVARRYGHRKPQADGKPRYEVLTFNKSFHGRTLGSMSATGQDKIKIGFDPMLPGFRHLPFNDLETAREAIRPETVAFMLETIQGEGGVNCVTPEFLRGLAQLCQEHDLLLLMDEVQCGFGRCGDIMGWRAVAPDVEPDGVSWAKALGGGFPIGGFWISDRAIDDQGTELASIMDPGSHGSTYGGNPLGTTVGLAVLREIVSQGLPERARRLGRGNPRGNRILEPARDPGRARPGPVAGHRPQSGDGGRAGRQDGCRRGGGGSAAGGPAFRSRRPETVRLLPPLNVSEEEVQQALAIIRRVLKTYVK